LLISLKREYIEKIKPSDMKKYDGFSFTRCRLLTIWRIVTIILRSNPSGLQIKLDDYYAEIGCKEEVVSKQAFSKARGKLDPEIVKGSFALTTKTMTESEDLEYYRGKYRLCAVDGSDVELDNAAELLAKFGGNGRNKDCATAMVSLCYDPLNNVILDGGIYPYNTCEREAARKHFTMVSALPKPQGVTDLYIFDRYYPSKEFFAEMIDDKMCFLMRVRRKFNVEFDSVKRNGTVQFSFGGNEYSVRIFRITLESGEEEILVSNLPGGELKRKDVGSLYFKRWGIETKFDSLKNKLELENWSGRRSVTVYQDFWAKLDLANTISALEFATDDVIKEATKDKDNKYAQTTNENRLISKFCDAYIELLATDNPYKRLALFDELVADIAKRPVEVKPDRNVERKTPRKKKFCDRRKRAFR
jgi:hypothetical protein